MRGIKVFFSQLFKAWAAKLEKPRTSQTILRRDIPVPRWLLFLMIVVAVLAALVSEFGFEKNFLLGAVICAAFWTYLMSLSLKFERALSDSKLLLTAIIVIASIVLTQIAKSKRIPMYFIFTPMAVSILNFLISKRIAAICTVLISMLVSLIYLGNFSIFFISLAGGVGAATYPKRIIRRSDLFLNGLSIFIFVFAAMSILHLFGIHRGGFIKDAVYIPLLVAVATSVFVMAFLPLFEGLFNITSDIRLIELSDFNQPLLKRLMSDAPGTYHHSLMVAALADAAASEIGCNSILARAGAYYHDIGKIKKPHYFVENQTGENVHENLKPEMSALVILSHTKEGLLLADEYGIDDCIKAFIAQHHGTTIVQYFFRKAAATPGRADETTYRYPGPLPQTRETAIVMLADSVEAACRALEDKNYEKIKDTVNKIINNYFAGGQLNECPITLKNIQKIGDVFTKTLMSIHHIRLEYPEALTEKK